MAATFSDGYSKASANLARLVISTQLVCDDQAMT